MASLLRRILISLVSTFFLASAAFAQTTSITDGKTPTGLTPGAPAGSYPLGDFDNINLFNGNLNFRIPLLKIGGRGSAGYTMTLPIEQKWIIKKGVFNSLTGTYPMTPNPNWWHGIKPGYGPGVLQGRRTGYGQYPFENYCGSVPNVFDQTLTRLTFTMADGTEYELRDQLTNGSPGNVYQVSCDKPGTSRGKIFVTADGSAATFISDTTIYDYKWLDISTSNRLFYPSGYLMLRDGTRYRIDNGYVNWIRDRNGNKVKFDGGTITDSINRTVTISLDDGARNYDEISYSGFPGYAGGAGRTIRVWYDKLQNRLRSGYSLQTFYQLFPLNSASTVTTYNPKRVSKVALPDGRFYQFYYNPYGELARVELPTGGAFEYDWDGITDAQDEVIFRYVIERRVYSNSDTCESKTQYLRNGEVKTYDGTGTHLLGLSKHYFEGDAFLSMVEDPARPSAINFSPWKEGREVKTEVFDIVAGSPVLKQKIEHTWQQPGASSTWPLISGQEETSLLARPNNPQITETKTTLADTNQVAKQTFKYDRYSNRTDIYEYDFGNLAPGGLIRRSHTDFLTTHSNGTDYACNPTTTCDNSASIDNLIHLRSLPTQQKVFDSSDIERSRQIFEYDNYSTTTNHAALLPRSNVSGLCAEVKTSTPCDNSNPAAFTRRGNVTAVSQYVLGTAVIVNTYSQYDVVGNVVKTINPRGYETTLQYNDVFGAPDGNARLNSAPLKLSQVNEVSYAFPTIITNARFHKVYSQFDYNTGQAVDVEDANGVVSSSYFNDLLDRPTQLRRAVGTTLQNQTTVNYDDAARSVTVSSDRDANNDNILVSKSLYDQLGRTVETRQYEGGTQYIAIKKIPFEVMQDGANWRVVSRTSNPYRPPGEQADWTTGMSDSIGRTIKVTTPDGASVTTAYSGSSVTVTDQAGKVRKSVTDALGRLKEVYEDPGSSPHLNYITTYEYDTLDNLKKVIQDNNLQSPVQPSRIFVYDSLKRLTSASNPESGTVSYQYDNSGNLTQKTDARGVVSTYVYDELNRITSVDYSDSTPDVFRQYDLALNGIGFINQIWQGGSATSATYIDSYDALGRPLVQRQRYETAGVWSSSYQTTRTYNLAGGVTSQIYPSGHIVTYTFDAAGRTGSFSGNLGDGSSRTYANNITYSPFGGPTREQFGTNTPVYHKSFYNTRGQLFDTRVSSVNDLWDWNRGRLILYYSSNHLWGQSGTDNNGNVRFAETWIPPENATLDQAETLSEQSYEYDSLNRLESVTEQRISVSNGWVWQPQFKQSYNYDRYGNRTIKTGAADTWGTGINNRSFDVETASNRLYSPGDLALADTQRRIRYDAAGNQTKDTYTGYGNATFDAENRITTIQDNLGGTSTYNYNADGQRTRRKINNQETWQVYGLDGELLAEYPANGATVSPQKEYGYRNGQLLITAEAPTGENVSWTNVVGATASGNSLTKTASTAWGNAGAASTKSIVSGDGYVEFRVTSLLTGMVALSHSDANQDYTSMEFALLPNSDGNLYVFESGVNRGVVSSYTTTDVFRVAVEGGVVKYRKNGTLVYTSTQTPTYPLLVDAGLYHNGGTFSNMLINGNLSGGGGPSAQIKWLVTDHLGTPRMIVDQTGTLANIKRHDYLPFGEELFAPTGGRSAAQGYVIGDNVRQQFTAKERDVETGLDYFGARYYGSLRGRFTSVDPLLASGRASLPQSWNRYSYVLNNPLKLVDPYGLVDDDPQDPKKAAQPTASESPLPKVTVATSKDPHATNGTEPRMNTVLEDGTYATGIVAPLTITVTDQSDKPLAGLTISETNKLIEAEPALRFKENPKTVTTDSTGSFTDVVFGNSTITPKKVSSETALEIIQKQVESRVKVVTEQTLTISAPGQGVIATAVYQRTITNLDDMGNLKSPTNSSGRHVNNFRVSVTPVTVSRPK